MVARKPKRVATIQDHLATTFPSVGQCRRCRAPVLQGLLWGMDAQYDPYPLNEFGELHTLMRGVRTFWMEHPQFRYRTASTIRHEKVPARGGVVRQHVCGTPPPYPPLMATKKDTTIWDDDDTPCPF